MQLISAGADGLLKLWSIKSSECIQTLDKHEARIWALCVTNDEDIIYSGGSDSMLLAWKDVTEEKKIREMNERKEMLLQEQTLNNLMSEKKMLKALKLALNLNRPLMTLKIVNFVIRSQEEGLDTTIKKLRDDHKETLLNHAITWNTNSRNCRPAQLVINILLQDILAGQFKVNELGKVLEAAIPYTERHFKRMTEYVKDLKFLEFTMNCMQPHAKIDDE
jgi:U3 small nucleolar RNA-associated protein 13